MTRLRNWGGVADLPKRVQVGVVQEDACDMRDELHVWRGVFLGREAEHDDDGAFAGRVGEFEAAECQCGEEVGDLCGAGSRQCDVMFQHGRGEAFAGEDVFEALGGVRDAAALLESLCEESKRLRIAGGAEVGEDAVRREDLVRRAVVRESGDEQGDLAVRRHGVGDRHSMAPGWSRRKAAGFKYRQSPPRR